MAESYKDITGPLVFTATVSLCLAHSYLKTQLNTSYLKLNAKPAEADELARFLQKEKAQSDKEPGTLRYDAVRCGDTFAVWETYAVVLPSIFACNEPYMRYRYASHEAIEL